MAPWSWDTNSRWARLALRCAYLTYYLNRIVKKIYNAHGESAQTAGPRSIGAEQESTQVDYNAFGQPTVSRRRLVGRWLSTPTSYDAAGTPPPPPR